MANCIWIARANSRKKFSTRLLIEKMPSKMPAWGKVWSSSASCANLPRTDSSPAKLGSTTWDTSGILMCRNFLVARPCRKPNYGAIANPSAFASLRMTGLVLQQLPRDHQPLNFARALTNRAQLHIAVKLLRRVIFDEPIPAVNLHTFVGAPHRDLAGVQLR